MGVCVHFCWDLLSWWCFHMLRVCSSLHTHVFHHSALPPTNKQNLPTDHVSQRNLTMHAAIAREWLKYINCMYRSDFVIPWMVSITMLLRQCATWSIVFYNLTLLINIHTDTCTHLCSQPILLQWTLNSTLNYVHRNF